MPLIPTAPLAQKKNKKKKLALTLSGTHEHTATPQNNCIHYLQGIKGAHRPFVESETVSQNGSVCKNVQ